MQKLAGLLLIPFGLLFAQVPNPVQNGAPAAPSQGGQNAPIFRVTVVSRTIKAINYHHRSGSTNVDFRGTELMPEARGKAKVESQMGSTKIETHVEKLQPAGKFGPEYLTYVLWAITPEGRPANLGEVVLEGDHAKLLSTTDLQAFGLIVTAEPYFAVTQPSDVVVMENFVRKDTTGTIQEVDANYHLLKRGSYTLNASNYRPVKVDPKGPLQLAEAENAVQIAQLAGADKYAADTMQKAMIDLKNAQDFTRGKGPRKSIETNAREATQMAEDARIITIRKMQAEERAREQAAAERDRQAAAQAQAEQQAEAARRAQAEQERAAAEQAKREAEAAAQRAATERAAADAARAAALQQQQQAQAEADRARQAQQQAEADREHMRRRLLQQLNTILETRETQRGLIVNISDVLFDFDKYSLKPGTREILAKVSGILLAYPGLRLQVEGYTDSVGSDEYNLKLSQQRADAVRSYLVSQNVPADTITSIGLGKERPVASNDTAAGRQQNRRVEMVVAGDVIGIPVQPPSTPGQAPTQ